MKAAVRLQLGRDIAAQRRLLALRRRRASIDLQLPLVDRRRQGVPGGAFLEQLAEGVDLLEVLDPQLA